MNPITSKVDDMQMMHRCIHTMCSAHRRNSGLARAKSWMRLKPNKNNDAKLHALHFLGLISTSITSMLAELLGGS